MKNKKIRVERPLPKINADKKVPELETGDSPSFSFIHLTRSGKFRLESLDPAVYREACALFYEKMNTLIITGTDVNSDRNDKNGT